MGFVLLGIGAVDALGISGAMLQMISHGLIAAAMFFVTGSFYERTNTLSIPNMGGLAKVLPITFAFFLAWELELVPVYLLIAIWGGKKKLYAATKFILYTCLLYTSPSPRDKTVSRMPSSA